MKPKVFIMWSGDASKIVAEALKVFLSATVQGVDYFVSTKDIKSGEVWLLKLDEELERSRVGIACLTRENLRSPWIHFEAGAVKRIAGLVIPYLIGIESTDVTGPLTSVQARRADEEGTRVIVKEINDRRDAGERLDSESIGAAFRGLWPPLKEAISEALRRLDSGAEEEPRKERDLLEEILERVRRLDRDADSETLAREALTQILMTGSARGASTASGTLTAQEAPGNAMAEIARPRPTPTPVQDDPEE